MGGSQSFDAFFKKILLPDEVVVHAAGGVVTGGVLRTASQCVAKIDVFDILPVEATIKGVAVILGVKF